MTINWDRVRDKVCEYYVNGKSLREVREIMATSHGFSASERSFRMKLTAWGARREDLKRSESTSTTPLQLPGSGVHVNEIGSFESAAELEAHSTKQNTRMNGEDDDRVPLNASTKEHYGNLVIELQELREECNRKKQQIEAHRSDLPDMDALKAETRAAKCRAAVLEILTKKAIEEAESAHSSWVAAQARVDKIEDMTRDLEDDVAKRGQKRKMLHID